ncbi:GNAT family N-acetyltransferase [Rhodococcus koreensis]|uniref:GNAT family N-acetyltransferase n=1 Tax=Rhodococcus koreensis TaxID=99653 RepID=UPI00366C1D66
MNIVALDPHHSHALTEFFGQLSDRDLTFIKEDLANPETIRRWSVGPAQQWLAVHGKDIAGFVAVRPLTEWSDHVAELRLVVHPAHRRAGIGRALARHALTEALRAGRRKVVVELAADQGHALAMFGALGFTGEALLRDHIRDRSGELHDLIMLAHFADTAWASIETIGITDELAIDNGIGTGNPT